MAIARGSGLQYRVRTPFSLSLFGAGSPCDSLKRSYTMISGTQLSHLYVGCVAMDSRIQLASVGSHSEVRSPTISRYDMVLAVWSASRSSACNNHHLINGMRPGKVAADAPEPLSISSAAKSATCSLCAIPSVQRSVFSHRTKPEPADYGGN